ncbi:baseplate J/gp47 family protein [Enterococcus sp. DIV1420a]|uniref:baseplate J/gp47 family protein n=1 Tax=Enterococcus sp. DIV1420a TaxID=2774672 RepID=UPI003F2734B3
MKAEEIGRYLEQYDYTYFLNAALEKVPEDIDTREGSIIYDALAPACYQMADFMMQLKNILLETFVVTATGQYLDYRAEEAGLNRRQATKAIVKAFLANEEDQPYTVALGSRFSSIGEKPIYYTVIQRDIEPGMYQLQAEIAGESGNGYIGSLLPLDHFNGLGSAKILEVIIPARDTESDEELRTRVLEAKEVVAFGGNITDYYQLTTRIEGVGAVQIYPTWQGGGTVRLVILNHLFHIASANLLKRVQEIIDPETTGQGLGYAPIGHRVTVAAPTEKIVNIVFQITLNTGVTLGQVEANVQTAIEHYFDSVRKKWDERIDNSYSCWIYRSQLIASILSVIGVANVQNLTLNRQSADIAMVLTNEQQELPVLGEVKIL